MLRLKPIWLLTLPMMFLTACDLADGGGADTCKIITPSGGGTYLGVYNWDGDGLDVFEQVLGRKVAMGMPYATDNGGCENTWPSFSSTGFDEAWADGYVWQVGIETGLGLEDPKFIPQDVIDGEIDAYLVEMAEDIATWGKPLFWMYPREPICQPGWGYDGGGYGPDGDLTREEAEAQGYSLYAEYGDPDDLDGPERYRDMCAHIHDVMAPVATNLTWVAGAVIARFDGAYTQWYPGDDYVDWHALDVYVGGEEGVGDIPFTDVIEPAWSEALALAPNKPVLLVEFGVSDRYMGDRSEWFKDFFEAAKTTHTELGAFIYWQTENIGIDTWIGPDDPCADDWYAEMHGPDAGWWLSDVETE